MSVIEQGALGTRRAQLWFKVRRVVEKEHLIAMIVVLLGLSGSRRFLYKWALLPESAYHEPILLKSLLSSPYCLLLLIGFCGPMLCLYKKARWDEIEQGYILRFFVFSLCIVIAWISSAYEYNLYYDQWHIDGRLMVLVLLGLLWWRPLFLPFFLVVAAVINYQLEYPLGDSWTHKRILFDLLVLFTVFVSVHFFQIWRKREGLPTHLFFFLALCLVATNYVYSGIGKLENQWIFANELSNLFMASYTFGWLNFFSQKTLLDIANILHVLNPVLLVGTLVAEIGMLFVMSSRKWAIRLLISVILLHLGILLVTGIFFWKWIVMEISLIVVLVWVGPTVCRKLFNRHLFIVSLAVILLSPFYFYPAKLAWIDSALTTTFVLKAKGSQGKLYDINFNFMSPYQITFVQNRFYYLIEQPMLVGTYGSTTNAKQAQAIAQTEGRLPQLEALRQERGIVYADSTKANQFETFITEYFGALNTHMKKSELLEWVAPIPHFYNFETDNAYDFQEKIKQVHVFLEESFYDGDTLTVVRNQLIKTIPIPNK